MRRFCAALTLGFLIIFGGATASYAAGVTDIILEDTAGVLDAKTLIPAIDDIKFNEPTKVAIYTRNGAKTDNFNEEVLRFARDKHPEWLSADGQKWADSLFIFALDPTGRQVGTYMGEDRKVSLDQRDKIQASTKSLFRDAQWTEGIILGVSNAASLMNQPWYKSTMFLIVSSIVGFLSVSIFIRVVSNRRYNSKQSKVSLSDGNASYTAVTMDLDITELNARTIPDSSSYGHLVLEKYRGFMNQYSNLHKLSNEANAITSKEMKRKKTVKMLKNYAKEALELDKLDDVIADTNMLLNMGYGWPEAWDRQLEELRTDAKSVETLLSSINAMPNTPSAHALTAFASTTLDEIEYWTAELSIGNVSPEESLDQIRNARLTLTQLLSDHSEIIIQNYAETKSEEKIMRTAMSNSAPSSNYKNSRSIAGTAYPTDQYWSVVGVTSGFRSSRNEVRSTRESNSSGSSTGYGSSGGSFSGSGSSSRF